MIEPGDILLFKGKTPIISAAVRWFTGSDYTHAGIAVTSDWVYEIDIDRKLAIHPIRNDDYDVFRYKSSLTEEQKTVIQLMILKRAKESKGYDWLKIIGLALEKFFRFPLIWGELNNEICSEIVDYIYEDIGIDLVPNRVSGHVSPSHISQSPELKKVFSCKKA